MIAYKFLGSGAVGVYSGFRWPAPRHGEPGSWVAVEGSLEVGSNGVHALEPDALTDWIDDELWLVELAGAIEGPPGLLLASRGRLLRRVEGWTAETARAFAWSCVLSTRDHAISALLRNGRCEEATALGAAGPAELQTEALRLRDGVSGFTAQALAFVADAVALFNGDRPEAYATHPGAGVPATPGAIAANLGYVAACAVGAEATDAAGHPDAFAGGFERERQRQRDWLAEQLALPAAPDRC